MNFYYCILIGMAIGALYEFIKDIISHFKKINR